MSTLPAHHLVLQQIAQAHGAALPSVEQLVLQQLDFQEFLSRLPGVSPQDHAHRSAAIIAYISEVNVEIAGMNQAAGNTTSLSRAEFEQLVIQCGRVVMQAPKTFIPSRYFASLHTEMREAFQQREVDWNTIRRDDPRVPSSMWWGMFPSTSGHFSRDGAQTPVPTELQGLLPPPAKAQSPGPSIPSHIKALTPSPSPVAPVAVASGDHDLPAIAAPHPIRVALTSQPAALEQTASSSGVGEGRRRRVAKTPKYVEVTDTEGEEEKGEDDDQMEGQLDSQGNNVLQSKGKGKAKSSKQAKAKLGKRKREEPVKEEPTDDAPLTPKRAKAKPDIMRPPIAHGGRIPSPGDPLRKQLLTCDRCWARSKANPGLVCTMSSDGGACIPCKAWRMKCSRTLGRGCRKLTEEEELRWKVLDVLPSSLEKPRTSKPRQRKPQVPTIKIPKSTNSTRTQGKRNGKGKQEKTGSKAKAVSKESDEEDELAQDDVPASQVRQPQRPTAGSSNGVQWKRGGKVIHVGPYAPNPSLVQLGNRTDAIEERLGRMEANQSSSTDIQQSMLKTLERMNMALERLQLGGGSTPGASMNSEVDRRLRQVEAQQTVIISVLETIPRTTPASLRSDHLARVDAEVETMREVPTARVDVGVSTTEGPGTGSGLVSRNIGDRPSIETISAGVQTSLSRSLTPLAQMATEASSSGHVVNPVLGLPDSGTRVSTSSPPRCTSPLVQSSCLADMKPSDGSIRLPLLDYQTSSSTDSSSQLPDPALPVLLSLPPSHPPDPRSTPPRILYSWSQSLSPLTVFGSQDVDPIVPLANSTLPEPVTDAKCLVPGSGDLVPLEPCLRRSERIKQIG